MYMYVKKKQNFSCYQDLDDLSYLSKRQTRFRPLACNRLFGSVYTHVSPFSKQKQRKRIHWPLLFADDTRIETR